MKALKTTKPTEDAAVYKFMPKKEAEGKHKKAAKIAGLNKFLRRLFQPPPKHQLKSGE